MDGRFFLAVLPSAIESTHLDHQLSVARVIGFRRESLRQSAVGTAPRAPDTRMELLAVASNGPSDVCPALLATEPFGAVSVPCESLKSKKAADRTGR